MPLIRKLQKFGNSRAITIPADWLEFYERQGKKIDYLLMEINAEIILRVPHNDEESKE